MRSTLSFRLLASTGIALVLTVVVVILLLIQFLNLRPEVMVGRALETAAAEVIAGIRLHPDGTLREVALPELMSKIYAQLPDDGAYRILDGSGKLLLSSDGASTPFVPGGAAFAPDRERFDVRQAGSMQRVLMKKVALGGRPGFVQVMRSDRIHQAMLNARKDRSLVFLIMIIVVPMAVFSVVVITTLQRTVLAPLRKMKAAVADIGIDSLGARLSAQGLPGELVPLVDAFNLTLGRLEHGVALQRDFLAAAAHELKTPIALMRAQLEMEGSADAAQLLRDLDHMARQVHQLLHLAEASEHNNYRLRPLALRPLVDDVLGSLERLAHRSQIAFTVREQGQPAVVSADGGSAFVLIRNLVENAIHHSPPHGTVTIVIERQRLTVQDAGPGIDAADLPRIFDRFWRGRHRRDVGAGLGLSICREIALAHGWQIEVEAMAPGTRFSVVVEGAGST